MWVEKLANEAALFLNEGDYLAYFIRNLLLSIQCLWCSMSVFTCRPNYIYKL